MFSSDRKQNSNGEFLDYTYPSLHTGKSWYVEFSAYDPARGKMRRKKYTLDKIPKQSDRRQRAAEIIEALMSRLRDGWSPWINSSHDRRGYTPFADAINLYRKSLERQPKYTTRKSYTSRVNILEEFMRVTDTRIDYVYQYTTAFVSAFLDWLYFEKKVSGRTRNNYRDWCSSLANFFLEREYITSNPVTKIKSVAEEAKFRKPLTQEMLKELSAYLTDHDPMYLLACMFEYYTFIRPRELTGIKLSDISLRDQYVVVPMEVSKNKRDGKVGLNLIIINLMLDLRIFDASPNSYLFGPDLCPSLEKGDPENFRRKWGELRKHFDWGREFQFYSLKDSGIRDLANAKGIVVARDQARHTDISTTNKYLKGRDMPVHRETQTFEGAL